MKIVQKTKNKFKQAGLSIVLSILFIYALVHPGYIQPFELAAYDFLLAKTLSPRSTNQHVLVLGQTEADIQRFGHPLSDQFFAELIEKLNTAGAISIGFDKLRDIPVAPGSKLLDKTLKKNKHVIWIYEFGSNIPPPEILKGSPQAGFSDMTQDPDSTVRRSLLLMRKDKKLQYAFPLLIALNYLYKKKRLLSPQILK